MSALMDFIQWPAMVLTVLAAYLVGSQSKKKRSWSFWIFLISNVLWIAWGVHDTAYALVVLQISLALLNIRGAFKNELN
jgi:uncharacterized MAPEG superfamily protein